MNFAIKFIYHISHSCFLLNGLKFSRINVDGLKSLIYILLLFCWGYAGAQGLTGNPSTEAAVDTLNSRGYAMIRHNASDALLLFVQAEQIAERLKYRQGMAAAYVNQAEVFNQRGYFERALLLYYHALSISQRDHDEYNVALCEQHISTVKRRLKRYAEAKKLLANALGIFTRLNKPSDVVNVQLRLGLLAQDLHQYDNARTLYEEAHQISIASKYAYGEKKSYYNRGLLYAKLSDYNTAIRWFNRALQIDTATHDLYGKSLSYLEIAKVYHAQNKYSEAQRYALLAYNNAEAVSGYDITSKAATLLLSINKDLHRDTEIIHWQSKLLTINELVKEQEKKEAVTFMDVYKLQQENQARYLKQIEQIKTDSRDKSTYIHIFLIIVCLGFALGIPLHISYRKAKAYAKTLIEKNEQIEEKSAAVEQLNSQITLQNNELEQDNSLKNKLLSIISHDLRHPLVNTRSLLDIYNQEMLSQEETKTLFNQLEAQYIRTITLLDNLLFWIKRQVQHTAATKVQNAVTVLIDEIIEEQRLAITNKGIKVSNHVDPAIIWTADREALRIVFRNLLNNALKFTPDNGRISFSSTVSAGHNHIIVKDSGIGMGLSKLKKVIAGSYMTTNGTAGEIGSGFGLLLVRDLISKDGAVLDIESSPGKGSTFTLTFPQADVERLNFSSAGQEIS